jgi:hypothetical protein
MSSSVCNWWRIKVPDAHYLETRTFGCHAIHVLCSANTLVILPVLLQIKNKFVLVFIITLITKIVLHVNNFFLLVERVSFEPGIL